MLNSKDKWFSHSKRGSHTHEDIVFVFWMPSEPFYKISYWMFSETSLFCKLAL